MSTADEFADAVSSPAARREALNPFDGCPWQEFVDELTYGYISDEYDGWSPLGDHHGEWLRHLAGEADADGDLILLCHRDGLKTTIITAFAIACLEYLDGYRVIWSMNTQEQAFEKADAELNKFIDRNPWLTNLNKPRETDSKKTKEFANGSSLKTGWLKGSIEGARAHLLILDDIISEQGDGSTQTVLNWVDGVAQPMVKDDGRTVMVGTRKRPNDIYSHYRDYEGYALREFPAVLDVWDQEFRNDDDWGSRRPDPSFYTEVENPWAAGETMHALWPEARGAEWLAGKRSKMADYLFWREYCLVIRGASGNLVDESDVNELAKDGGCSIRGQSPPRQLSPGAGEATIVAHDPATSPTGDNAAFTAWRVGRDGRRTLLDAIAEKGMQPSDVKATMLDLDDRYDPAVIVIEDNGVQQYIREHAISFSSSMMSKIVGIPTTGKKHSWENGIPRLRTLVENGGLQLYRGHDGTEDFVQAMLSLELSDGKLKGHTPDLIASWYMAEQGIRRLEDSGALDDDQDSDDSGVSYL
ncbi:phage terminase large subunit family protein [Natrialba aegyptia]|uniref:Terminase large subunit gp17-like C-terminal domain-containing protein n=1 Tax=Natrialba aegyptia DSM 13077 TaxID=1227491 RepID=M0B4Z5_9EURY|nr:hypothetical protein [Natrialba aegyptia]ELZ05582.1 hypothetical protein C480_10390 [Natrialba aegyptia DSM 13077]